jgi:hypothetical protein
MADQATTTREGMIPHYGAASPGCLPTVLPPKGCNPLTRSCNAPFDGSRTAGETPVLPARSQLLKIRGPGPVRIPEAGVAQGPRRPEPQPPPAATRRRGRAAR